MPVTLSIENAPDDIVARLKARATRNHRSLQSELKEIITAAAEQPAVNLKELSSFARAIGLETPDESAQIVRNARDARRG